MLKESQHIISKYTKKIIVTKMPSSNTKADQWNLIEYPEIKLHNWDQLISYKGVKKIHRENDILFSYGAGKLKIQG